MWCVENIISVRRFVSYNYLLIGFCDFMWLNFSWNGEALNTTYQQHLEKRCAFQKRCYEISWACISFKLILWGQDAWFWCCRRSRFFAWVIRSLAKPTPKSLKPSKRSLAEPTTRSLAKPTIASHYFASFTTGLLCQVFITHFNKAQVLKSDFCLFWNKRRMCQQ